MTSCREGHDHPDVAAALLCNSGDPEAPTAPEPKVGAARSLLESAGFEGLSGEQRLERYHARELLQDEIAAARVFARQGQAIPDEWTKESDDPRAEAFDVTRGLALKAAIVELIESDSMKTLEGQRWEREPLTPERLLSLNNAMISADHLLRKAKRIAGELLKD